MTATTVGTVSALARYAVKSLQGEELTTATVTETGVEGDRSWGIVDTGTGQVLTAKRTTELLDGRAHLDGDEPVIELPDGTRLAGPGAATDAALSEWLDRPVTLQRAGAEGASFSMTFNVDDEDQDVFEWPTPPGTFLDLAPVHLLTTASLAAAAAEHPDGTWSVHRFRPSILVDTQDLGGFVENDWVGATLQIGDAALSVTMPTIRCTLPTRPQAAHGLERDVQIFKSLAAANSQNLGAYATVTTPGALRLGDPVVLVLP
jgi:uncharacterized protein YcbX